MAKTKTTPKTYYATVANSRFVYVDGTEEYFIGGRAVVDIKEHQVELDAILGKNPTIYVQEALPVPFPQVPQNAKSEKEIEEGDKSLQAGGNIKVQTDTTNQQRTQVGGMFGPTLDNMQSPASPAAVQIDNDIQAAMNSGTAPVTNVIPQPNLIGPGAQSKVAELRRQAAERTPIVPVKPETGK